MINLDELSMRVGLGQFQELSDERLQFIKQCGCDDFQMTRPRFPERIAGNVKTSRNSFSARPTPACD